MYCLLPQERKIKKEMRKKKRESERDIKRKTALNDWLDLPPSDSSALKGLDYCSGTGRAMTKCSSLPQNVQGERGPMHAPPLVHFAFYRTLWGWMRQGPMDVCAAWKNEAGPKIAGLRSGLQGRRGTREQIIVEWIHAIVSSQ